jgi:hypothetical protein
MTPRKKPTRKASKSAAKEKAAPSNKPKGSRSRSKKSASSSQTKGELSPRVKSAPQSSTRKESQSTSKKSPTAPIISRPSRAKPPGSYSKEKRAAAAARGWQTRRANDIARQRVNVLANNDEPGAGNYAYKLYDDSHPLHGDPSEIAKWDEILRPYYGKRLRITVNGMTLDPDGERGTRTYIRRVGQVNGYTDVFGPGSLYYDAIKAVRNRHSTEEMDVLSLSVEIAAPNDRDTESAIRTKAAHVKKVTRAA